ncbi:hypothetical protein [Lysobacter antibioticus]|uniref:hypothetical protein n=1 Tax=Lysobacter antibioticus TaxID=84531 RepID=UPI000716FF07|nr:hypothetical protein [Lysobacter antibioticus]
MKNLITRIAYIPQSERFSAFFAIFMVMLSLVGLWLDITLKDGFYWFQRTGALLVLAGVELQYAKLTSLWKNELGDELNAPTVRERLSSGQGISMLQEAQAAEATRGLAVRLHRIVTDKSMKDVAAVISLIIGTIIWAFGDLPFRI